MDWTRAPALRRPAQAVAAAAILLWLAGCAAAPAVNASFPLTLAEAREDLARMRADPRPAQRPILVLGGWMDPGFSETFLTRTLERVTCGQPVLGLSFAFDSGLDACREKTIRCVESVLPEDDAAATAEVDVIAFSMGGLVARYAAAAIPGASGAGRLTIRRLYTISTPHRGAVLASLPALNRLQTEMRTGSGFLVDLDRLTAEADYPLICYVREPDPVIGAANAAPPEQGVYWTPRRLLESGHHNAWRDPRIIADIARRLRGEEPHTRNPPSPLPLRS